MISRGILSSRATITSISTIHNSSGRIIRWNSPNKKQIRSKTWFNPFSKFNNKQIIQTPTSKSKETTEIIIEEPQNNNLNAQYETISSLKHYLKTTDVPSKIRKRILIDKLTNFINDTPQFRDVDKTLSVLNNVFLELYKLNGKRFINEKTGELNGILEVNTLEQLFERSSLALLQKHTNAVKIPEYVKLLAKFFMTQKFENLKIRSLICIIELASLSKSNTFSKALSVLIKNKQNELNPKFFNELLNYYQAKGSLSLSHFEDIFEISLHYAKIELLDDQVYLNFIKYVENIYSTEPPLAHEYKNLERSIYRLQYIMTNKMNLSMVTKYASSGCLIQLMKFAYELNLVNENQELQNYIKSILKHLTNQKPEVENIIFEEIRREIFKQDLDDESLVENLLILSYSPKYSTGQDSVKLVDLLFEYIEANDVKFSKNLRFQNRIYKILNNKDFSEHELTEKVQEELNTFIQAYDSVEESEGEPIDFNDIYTRIIQSAMILDNIPARGYFTHTIKDFLQKDYTIENSMYAYKYRLDQAIGKKNHVQAINIFDDSLQDLTHWTSSNDPSIQSTLNNLIILICEKMNNITDIFPIFTKIKQQMTTQCSIKAIHSLSIRMLKNEYVGDLIEMMKRELPTIKKESKIRLPIEESYGIDYKNFFTLLHNFIISYDNESTHETNWVLYGELHKYFNVPFESYLPTMKFFVEHERLNAALIIFRQIHRLNELHGDHKFKSPSREMYIYLFEKFGDALYEDGIIELHEKLKMDINLSNQDINLQNSLLNAYSNLQDIPKVQDLFLSMSSNAKQYGGINEETVRIMIKSYTYGDMRYVKEFWNNLSNFGILPNDKIFKQYLIAHVYHGKINDAFEITEEMKEYGFEISTDILLSMHNFCLEIDKQKLISEWADLNYKNEWDSVKKSGLLKGATNYMPSDNLIAGES